jgi:hypothetical protein
MTFVGRYPSLAEMIAETGLLAAVAIGSTIFGTYLLPMAIDQVETEGKLRKIENPAYACSIAQNTLRKVDSMKGIQKLMSAGKESGCKYYLKSIVTATDTNAVNEWMRKNPTITIYDYSKTQGGNQNANR